MWQAILTATIAILSACFLGWIIRLPIRAWLHRTSPPLGKPLLIGFSIFLVTVDLILSVLIMIAGALSHSARENMLIPWKWLLLSIVVVGGPVSVLVLSERYRVADFAGKRRIGFLSTVVFLILTALGLFALGRIGFWPPILYAARNGHAGMEKWLIELGAEVNVRDRYDGHSPLDFAAYWGDVEMTRLLLQQRAKDNSEDDRSPWPALMMASMYGHTEVVRLLLPMEDNTTEAAVAALGFASSHNQSGLVEFLLDRGADPTSPDRYFRRNAFEAACQQGQIPVLQALLRRAKSIPQLGPCAKGLIQATILPDLETIDLLIRHGADINAQDDGKRTALMVAAMKGNLATVRFLLDRNADPNLTDYQSKTALDYAEEYRHPAICELLRGIRKE